MKTRLLSVCAALALAVGAASAAQAAPTTIKVFNTGYDDVANAQLANGTVDTDWSIVAGGTAGHVGAPLTTDASPLPGSYVADNDSLASRWIAIETGVESFGITTDPGTYKMQTSVNVGAQYNLSMVVIPTLRFAVDDNVLDISINGTSVYTHLDCGCDFATNWTTLSCVGQGLFQTGDNEIVFTVKNNSSDPNPMALRVEGSVAEDCGCSSGAGVPEPASLGVLAIGALGLLARRRRN